MCEFIDGPEVCRFPTDTEIRYVNSRVDKTTFLTGARNTTDGTMDIMMLRNDSAENENPSYIACPIATSLLTKPDGDLWLGETITLEMENEYDGETICYLLTADMVDNPLWSEADEEHYGPLCEACKKNYVMKYGDGNGVIKASALDENGEGVFFDGTKWKAVINVPDVAEPK